MSQPLHGTLGRRPSSVWSNASSLGRASHGHGQTPSPGLHGFAAPVNPHTAATAAAGAAAVAAAMGAPAQRTGGDGGGSSSSRGGDQHQAKRKSSKGHLDARENEAVATLFKLSPYSGEHSGPSQATALYALGGAGGGDVKMGGIGDDDDDHYRDDDDSDDSDEDSDDSDDSDDSEIDTDDSDSDREGASSRRKKGSKPQGKGVKRKRDGTKVQSARNGNGGGGGGGGGKKKGKGSKKTKTPLEHYYRNVAFDHFSKEEVYLSLRRGDGDDTSWQIRKEGFRRPVVIKGGASVDPNLALDRVVAACGHMRVATLDARAGASAGSGAGGADGSGSGGSGVSGEKKEEEARETNEALTFQQYKERHFDGGGHRGGGGKGAGGAGEDQPPQRVLMEPLEVGRTPLAAVLDSQPELRALDWRSVLRGGGDGGGGGGGSSGGGGEGGGATGGRDNDTRVAEKSGEKGRNRRSSRRSRSSRSRRSAKAATKEVKNDDDGDDDNDDNDNKSKSKSNDGGGDDNDKKDFSYLSLGRDDSLSVRLLPADSYVDFHMEQLGRNTWRYLQQGEQWLWIAPPTAENIAQYAEWMRSPVQRLTFFGDLVS